MNQLKIITAFLLLISSSITYAQLGFCTGSKGEPIFTENFGNGTNYGPALPAGTTNYNFVVGAPNDGSYTLFYRTNLYSTWHYSLDHTPDATNGVNGKALVVNASANTTGDFYRRVVTGLCVNTTFEFSAWVMNVYNPGSGFCGASEIPINVRFEIWNDTETVLLGSGNTGNIMGTASPIWLQYALVFTTGSETSVVLKMKNNGLGGCGNDLAIDDIEFRACGELTTVMSPPLTGGSFQLCSNDTPVSLTFQASTTGVSPHFYQWQSSSNGTTWTDIPGANLSSYTASISTPTFFRAKAAQDIANLNNSFCSTVSNVFTVSFLNSPAAPISNGNVEICGSDPFLPLSVSTNSTSGVNWYDAPTGGNLLQSNSTTFTPTAAGTYYAETYDYTTNCLSSARIPVTLTIVPSATATISATTPICSGNTTVVSFNGTPNADVTYKIDGGTDQLITLDGSGSASITTPVLNSNTTYTLISVASPISASCNQTLSASVTITVNQPPTATISGDTSLCVGATGTIQFIGTPNATVYYNVNSGPNQSTVLNTIGERTVAISNITTNTVVTITEVRTLGANGCSQPLNQSITFTVVQLPTATISVNPTAVCEGDTVVLTFTGTTNSQVTYTENGGANQTVNIGSSGTATVTTSSITSATTFQLVRAELVQSPFCFQSISGTATVTINPTPTAAFTGDLTYCSGETTAISLSSNLAGTTYAWTVTQNGTTGATAGSGDQINQLLTATTDGTATYIVTPSFNGCAGSPITIEVDVYAIPNPTLSDGAICLLSGNTSAQPYVLDTGLTTSDYSFEWYFEGVLIPNANDSTYEAFQIGEYAVVATNLVSGCVSPLETAMVSQSVLGDSLVIEQSEAFSENPTIIVTVVGGQGPFYYQLDDFGFQTSNVFMNVAPGFHTITVVDDSLCTNLTGTATIINYPKFFTPNGDGYNDTWNISGVDGTSIIYIFDRYGKLLKQISPLGTGWDGTHNGQPAFSSDYWFIINYPENGIPKTFKSHFSLKR